MKRILLLVVAVVMMASPVVAQSAKQKGYVIVTDYVKANGKKDVSDVIQKIIDDNPNRTIYFPDGVYLISKPICTPADPRKSVSLDLSNYAVIKATEDWSHDEAMVRLGGKDPYNNIEIVGSNYYLSGGIIDGSGVAKGISIDSGRETVIRNTSIKNVTLGIHVKYGANSGSSDADISGVNIVGNNTPKTVGVLVEGHDNTFTNMRVAGCHIGFIVRSGANSLRNIHPLYYGHDENYQSSIGFLDERYDNWYDFCYSDEFATGFQTNDGRNIYSNCFTYWYAKSGSKHTAFRSTGAFNSDVMNLNVGFGTHNATKENVVLEVARPGGLGVLFNLHVGDEKFITSNTHIHYMR
ncbi:MAG: hypothetical protein IIY15_06470 [Flavobacteriales bacterium]|nr:hypothetical protein [Flavobacteriales bacterium]